MNFAKKIISSIMVASMVLTCAVSAFADNFTSALPHEFTVEASKTTNLSEGDEVVVTIKIDQLLGLTTLGYCLKFDKDAFEVDTTSGGRGKPPKYIDTTWYNEIKDEELTFGYYMGKIGQNGEIPGEINIGWAGGSDAKAGVPSEENAKDYVVGKFILKAKAGIDESKEYSFTLTDFSAGTYVGGYPTEGAATCKYTNKSVMTAKPEYTVDGKYTAAMQATIMVPASSNMSGIAFKFTSDDPRTGGSEGTAEVSFGDNYTQIVKSATVTAAINILNVPEGVTLTFKGAEAITK